MAETRYVSWAVCVLVTLRAICLATDFCSVSGSSRSDCHPEPGAVESKCHARGCCWRPPADQNDHSIPWCFQAASGQCDVSNIHRADCHADAIASPSKCFSRGCCWKESQVKGVAWCFYPSTRHGYTSSGLQSTTSGFSAPLALDARTHWPNEVTNLKLDVFMETQTRVRFKIYDPNNVRYEVPIVTPSPQSKATNTDYTVSFRDNVAGGIVITRKSTGSVLFDSSTAAMTFADQYIEITTTVPTKYIYGLGEHRSQFWLDPSTSPKLAFWSRDQPPNTNANMYGVHPFFLGMEEDGNAFGVFLLNSNAMEVDILPLSPTILRYRTIGGILDFFVFTGPSADDVIKQYSEVIGRTFMPPYWSLGFHLSRWGYNTGDNLKTVIHRMRSGNIPYDVQWGDIDYMRSHLDWTYDTRAFNELPAIVKELHKNGQKFIPIVDPGISTNQSSGSYAPYDNGVAEGVFIKSSDGNRNLVGNVWPGLTVFPDFTNPKTTDWWTRHARDFHNIVPFDGLWIDMNEPANFYDGSDRGCTGNSLDNPPFVPAITDHNLFKKTLCPSARQHLSTHYNLHSLYGHFEAKATAQALKSIRGKRSLVISRSTFAGSGQYGGHWTGDNYADWNNLYYSIPAMLSFNMFGLPMVGADICGYAGSASEELCVRWMQLGAFYPFMRNHRDLNAGEHDPSSPRFFQTQHMFREVLQLRYTLLPYLYTLFYNSHTTGVGVVRPLFFQFPHDKHTFTIDKQFLWGEGLMVSPVTQQGARSVTAYFPADTWYDYYTGERIVSSGTSKSLNAPLDKINLHVLGGVIIPTQENDTNTVKSRQKPFGLVVALGSRQIAEGYLFWDDGESYGTTGTMNNNYMRFTATANSLQSNVERHEYQSPMKLGSVRIFGIQSRPTQLVVNGAHSPVTYDNAHKVLSLHRLNVDMLHNFRITWSYDNTLVG